MEETKIIYHQDVPYRNHISNDEIIKLHPRSQYEKHGSVYNSMYNSKEYNSDGVFIGETTGEMETNIQLRSKPKGLWFSLKHYWLNFTDYEEKKYYEYTGYIYNIKINEDTFISISEDINPKKILRLNSMSDRNIFYQKYKREGSLFGFDFGSRFQLIDWVQVSNDYAGLEIPDITRGNQLESKWCCGWDVPSGCIWNTNIIEEFKIV